MNWIKLKWHYFNNWVLKKSPLAWLSGTHIVLLFLPLLFVLYTIYFSKQEAYYSIFVKSIPLYFNVLAMMVLLFFCYVRRKLLVNWKHFTRYLVYLFANGFMLSVVLAFSALVLKRDPLKICDAMKSKDFSEQRLEEFKNKLREADVWNMDNGSALLYYAGVVEGSALDSVSNSVTPEVETKYATLCKQLNIPEAVYGAQAVVPDEEGGYVRTYRDLLHYVFEEKAKMYMLGLHLNFWNFFLTSMFLLGNMICFFLAVQVINKKETTKNILFFITNIIAAIIVIASLDSLRTDLKDPFAMTGMFLLSMLINFIFHRGRKFVEGIQKLLVFLHAFMWIVVIGYTSTNNLERFIIGGEVILFAVSVSITFFVFKRFFQPQKIAST